jgi:hypothetical protein
LASIAIWIDPAGEAADTLTRSVSAPAAPVRKLRAWVANRRRRG